MITFTAKNRHEATPKLIHAFLNSNAELPTPVCLALSNPQQTAAYWHGLSVSSPWTLFLEACLKVEMIPPTILATKAPSACYTPDPGVVVSFRRRQGTQDEFVDVSVYDPHTPLGLFLGSRAAVAGLLVQYVAAHWECRVGVGYFMTSYLHVQPPALEQLAPLLVQPNPSPYWGVLGLDKAIQITKNSAADLKFLLDEGPGIGLKDRWVRRVATPIIQAGEHEREPRRALEELAGCEDTAWRTACENAIKCQPDERST